MADGQVLIDSKLNTSGVQKGTRELKEEFQDLAKVTEKVAAKMEKELDNTGNAAEEASSSFKELFKANLSADLVTGALKEMGEAAIELGKQAVAAAADINASNAQFEQTFKGLEKTARDSLNAIAKQTGITATRMQDSYTSIFAFSKSIGADQAQALDISSRAIIAAADSAAYYDKSIEEATETLQSFLKGNYENDAALGIAATETTRNAKANEMYAKSFIELSEAQKVDVLLAMVEAGNEASGAMGQAAREADSWTNVTGELNEAWRLLLGVLGDPLLEGLIPIIQGITSAMKSLIETSASGNLAAEMNSFRDSISNLDAEFEKSSEAIEKNAIMAELYKDRLLELEKEGFAPNTAASREYANAVDALNSIYPELNLQIDEQTGLLNENSKAQLNNLNAMKQKAVYAAQEKKLTAALEAQADAILEVQAAQKALQAVQTESAALEQQLMELTGKSAQELSYLYGNRSLAIHELTSEQLALMDQIIPLIQEEKRLQQGIEEGNALIAAQDAEMAELKAECDATAASLGIVTEAEQETAAATDEAAKAQEELAKRFQDAKESARDSLNSTIGLFSELKIESDLSAEQIVKNLQSQQKGLSDYESNLRKLVEMKYPDELVKQIADGSEKSMAYAEVLAGASSETVAKIIAEWEKTEAISDTTEQTMAEIETNLTAVTESVSESVDGAVSQVSEGAADVVEEAGKSVVEMIEPVTGALDEMKTEVSGDLTEMEGYFTDSWGRMVKTVEDSVKKMDVSSLVNDLKNLNEEIKKLPTEVSSAAEQAYDDVAASVESDLAGAGETITESILVPVQEGVETLGSTIEETFGNAADTMETAWSDNAQWFESNVTTPIEQSTEDMGKTMLETISEMESESAEAWKQMASEAGQQIDSMNGKIPSVGNTMHETLSRMESENSAAWNRMVEAVARAIDQMQAKINSLKGKTVPVSVTGGFNAFNSYAPQASSIGIPMLATGTVIPPSAAYSVPAYYQGKEGSQEETDARLRQIIQEELGNIVLTNEINFAGELAPLARILYPEIRTEARRVGRNLAEEVLE